MQNRLALLFLTGIFFCLWTAQAGADMNYYNVEKPIAAKPPVAPEPPEVNNPFLPAQNMVVTSLQKCFDQLPPAIVQDIKRHYFKPYEECQSRLQQQQQKAQEDKVAADKAAAEPETPRNYVRVQKSADTGKGK